MIPALTLFLFLISSLLATAQSAPGEPPMPGKLVDVGGYRVHLYCTGEGSPTILVASGGFSFDWGLVQPQVAKFTQICTYDPAGTAWSEPAAAHPHPNCANRVDELHALVKNAGVGSPYVLVGFSLGGLVARLYASRYPSEIAGMVLVDHAFVDTGGDSRSAPQTPASMPGVDTPPVLISKPPIALDLEDDQNFSKLPQRDQELHRWALSIHSIRPTVEMAAECFSEVDTSEQGHPHPLGNKPLVVVSTLYDSPRYTELQNKLLALSLNSKQFVADHSSHMVIIDQPEVIVQAIQYIIQAVHSYRSETKGSTFVAFRAGK